MQTRREFLRVLWRGAVATAAGVALPALEPRRGPFFWYAAPPAHEKTRFPSDPLIIHVSDGVGGWRETTAREAFGEGSVLERETESSWQPPEGDPIADIRAGIAYVENLRAVRWPPPRTADSIIATHRLAVAANPLADWRARAMMFAKLV